MNRKTVKRILAPTVVAAMLGVVAAWALTRGGPGLPRQAEGFAPESQSRAGGQPGYGWSTHPGTTEAVKHALAAAGKFSEDKSDAVFVFYTTQHEPERIVATMQALAGPGLRILGWSSDYGVIGPDGYHASPGGSLGLLRVRLPGVTAGLGWAELHEAPSADQVAQLAVKRAMEDAGRPSDPPAIIVMAPTYDGCEEQLLKGIDAVTGGQVPVIGGTAAGSSADRTRKGSAIAKDKVIRTGLVLAVLYSRKPVAWAYRGGFNRTGKSGTVTASDGRVIRKIDGRPALDVYDEWSGGRVSEAMRAGKEMNKFTGLYPLCRVISSTGSSQNLFIHPWPVPDADKPKCLVTSASVYAGEVVYFSEGSWNILLNRIGALPQLAKEGRSDMEVGAGLLICCEAVLKNIPPDQRDQISYLMNLSLGGAPWIGMFTWGEQGNFPGLGNHHGNLLTGTLLLPKGEAQRD